MRGKQVQLSTPPLQRKPSVAINHIRRRRRHVCTNYGDCVSRSTSGILLRKLIGSIHIHREKGCLIFWYDRAVPNFQASTIANYDSRGVL